MSRSKRIGKAGAAAAGTLDHVRQAVAQAKPYASGARATAGRGVRRVRAVAAPQVESVGRALEDRVAPKVSAMLSSAAQRLEPSKPRRRRWRKLAGISLLTAVGAIAAVVRNRAKPDVTPPEETDTAETRDEQATTSTDADADVDRQVGTS